MILNRFIQPFKVNHWSKFPFFFSTVDKFETNSPFSACDLDIAPFDKSLETSPSMISDWQWLKFIGTGTLFWNGFSSNSILYPSEMLFKIHLSDVNFFDSVKYSDKPPAIKVEMFYLHSEQCLISFSSSSEASWFVWPASSLKISVSSSASVGRFPSEVFFNFEIDMKLI